MSNRSLIELNHDYCPRDDAGCLALGRALQAYLRCGDADLLPPGVRFRHYRHYSDPDPMAGRDQRRGADSEDHTPIIS
jgi:hypothetical protein